MAVASPPPYGADHDTTKASPPLYDVDHDTTKASPPPYSVDHDTTKEETSCMQGSRSSLKFLLSQLLSLSLSIWCSLTLFCQGLNSLYSYL